MKVFRKTGVSTLINILGMSVAFAAAMILMVQVRWDTTYDANFKGHKQVFRMENNWMDDGPFSAMFSKPLTKLSIPICSVTNSIAAEATAICTAFFLSSPLVNPARRVDA